MSASPVVTSGMAILALLVAAMFVLGVARSGASRRTISLASAGDAAWLSATYALGASGVLLRFDLKPPPMTLLMVAVAAVGLGVGASRLGAALASLPIAALVGAQAFRLPLELLMHQAAVDGTMPMQMSFSGWNFDIVTGASAIVVAVLARRSLAPRWVLLAWNALGTALLAGIIGIAAASTPVFAAFGSEPGKLNTWIAHAPFTWLPTVLVAAAIVGHTVLWRRLLIGAPDEATS